MTPRTGSVNTRACHWALVLCFAAGAAIGALFVLAGPVPFVRLLGAVALFAGIAGCALHVRLMGVRASTALRAMRRRAVASARSIGAVAAQAAGPSASAALLRPRAASQ